MLPPPALIEAARFDEEIPQLPNSEAVFLVRAGAQSAYLAKTAYLRRRLLRILKPGEQSGRLLNLRGLATEVRYWLTGSRFESTLLHYRLAREEYPDTYLKMIKLRMPPYVRLLMGNAFPRTQIAASLGGKDSVNYGPFRSRATAEQFENELLDMFQLRRCQEDLAPNPDHAGCIYGEMNKCLRPCQQIVGPSEYRAEALRVAEFLETSGRRLIHTIESARDRLSDEMQFELAAQQHQRLERIQSFLTLRDGLAADVDHLYGIAITPAARDAETVPDVLLWFFCQGCWQLPVRFPLQSHVSMDARLREVAAGLHPVRNPRAERQEHLALLSRWYHSSWRDGEWLDFPSLDEIPYRKLVRAISRAAASI